MATKDRTIFVCSNCGNEYAAWQGRCEGCQEWNTLREMRAKSETRNPKFETNPKSEISNLSGINIQKTRVSTKIGEVDRVLGGGLVPGSVVLISGDPGIGKSTLLLQLAQNVKSALFISGEESKDQVGLRAYRLGVKASQVNFLAETNVENILAKLEEQKPILAIIDSIQTMWVSDFPSTPGSLVQVRESAMRLQQFAKAANTTLIFVGHVTKDGAVAGPKILEHLVDVTIYLEGERYYGTRILRGVKNRFGPTDEIGVFAMSEAGLVPVDNPSKLLLRERLADTPGSVVSATVEGTRPLLVEVQALTARSAFGYPKRTSTGFDLNRLNLIIAVLQQRAGLKLHDQDIYVNIVGGVTIKEPAVDLAVATAIASAFKNKSVSEKLAVWGELGLSGEIRQVSHDKKRVQEAKRLGFEPYEGKQDVLKTINHIL